MKLELKHLAPYLPYGLKCKWNQSKPFELKGLQHGSDSVNNEMWIWKDKTYFIGYLYECKPILRPLSDLTEDIVIGNVKFIPIDILFEKEHPRHLSKRYYSETFYNYASVSHNGTAVNLKVYLGKIIEQNPRWIFEYLLIWHFDVFGLIEKGLAIDINTIFRILRNEQ